VVEVQNGRIDTQPLSNWIVPVAGNRTYPDLPSLRNIFLACISPKNGETFSVEDTFNLKYDLRRLFANDKKLRHFIMGTVKDERISAKVKISRPYSDDLMRVWGWIPEEADVYKSSWNRERVVSEIYKHLNTNYSSQVWREMISSRDTVTPDNGDALAFLRNLLGLQEEDDAA